LEDLSALRGSAAPEELETLLLANFPLFKLAVDLSHIGNALPTDAFDLLLLLLC